MLTIIESHVGKGLEGLEVIPLVGLAHRQDHEMVISGYVWCPTTMAHRLLVF